MDAGGGGTTEEGVGVCVGVAVMLVVEGAVVTSAVEGTVVMTAMEGTVGVTAVKGVPVVRVVESTGEDAAVVLVVKFEAGNVGVVKLVKGAVVLAMKVD